MLHRNIDITLGLLTGGIGTIRSVKFSSIDQASLVESMTVHFGDDRVHQPTRVKSKFQVLEKAYVIRQQFPITIAYSITIHKCQGLTLHKMLLMILVILYLLVVKVMLHCQGLPTSLDYI